MKQKIMDYLGGRNKDYHEGLMLLGQVCPNRVLIRNLGLKENARNRDKLMYELGKAVDSLVDHSTAKKRVKAPVKKKKVEVPVELKKVIVESNKNYPDELNEKIIQLGMLQNKRGKLSNSLRTFAPNDNEGRKKVLEEMDTITQQMTEIREARNYYDRYGAMPDFEKQNSKPLPENIMDLMQMLQNKKTSRSKYRKKLQNAAPSSSDAINAQNKLTKLEQEISELESITTIRKEKAVEA